MGTVYGLKKKVFMDGNIISALWSYLLSTVLLTREMPRTIKSIFVCATQHFMNANTTVANCIEKGKC